MKRSAPDAGEGPSPRSKRHKRSSQSQIATRISFQTLSTETPPPESRECEWFDPADVVPDGMKREETGQSTSRHVRALDHYRYRENASVWFGNEIAAPPPRYGVQAMGAC
jgi:hypothetical protein